jgi:predicted PurR-regulated permease PerM
MLPLSDPDGVAVAPDQDVSQERRVRPGRTRDAPTLVAVAPRTIFLFVVVAIGALLLLALVYTVRGVLTQLIVAVVLAMAAEPLVQILERRGLRRGSAVGISFTLLVLAFALFAYLLVTPLVHETRRLVADGPQLLQQLTQGHGRLGFLEHRFHIVERARAQLDSGRLTSATGPAMHVIGSAVHTGGAIVFVAFLTLFVQLGGRQWFASLVDLVPERARTRVRRAGRGVSAAVGGYVAGNLLISVVAGTVTTIVLLATSVPYALPLGLLVAIFDLIPLVGATLATVLVGLVAATRGFGTAAIVVGAMALYQQVENHSLQQLVYHRTVKLSPLAIAVSVAAGAELGGVVGALLGIPAAGALKVVSAEVVAWRRGEDAPA